MPVVFGRVDRVVEPPEQAVRVVLDTGLAAAVGIADELLRVGLEIAVGVLHQPQVRWLSDQDAVVGHLDRSRQHQLVREHGPLVHDAVAILIFQDDNVVDRLARVHRVRFGHEPGHLENPQPPVRIEIDGDGIHDQRLFGDELRVISGRQHERLRLFLGRENGGLRRCLVDLPGPGITRRGHTGRPRRRPGRPGLDRVHHSDGSNGEHRERRGKTGLGQGHDDSKQVIRIVPPLRSGGVVAALYCAGISRATMPGVDDDRLCPGSCMITYR